jgi:hypothetical protein
MENIRENREEKNSLIDQLDSSGVTIIGNLSFGKSYGWQVFAYDSIGRQIGRSENYSFTITRSPWLDSTRFRTRIINNDTADNAGGLVCLDFMRTIIDRQGFPVWFFPETNAEIKTAPTIRDLRFTHDGNITFLTERNIYECDELGKILWKGPDDGKISGDTSEFYHHCFRKLNSGNYMVLGNKYVYVKIPYALDSSKYNQDPDIKMMNSELYKKVEFGTIIEYDSSGKVLWSWDSQHYLSLEDIFYRKMTADMPLVNAHLNSFDIDEKTGIVYAGFRNFNRVVVIDKETGQVLNSIGAKMPSGEARSGDGFFIQQHDSRILPNGNLAVFNNDSVSKEGVVSSVIIFSLPKSLEEESRILWKFNCNFDSLTNGKSPKFGNITALPNGHFLVCMGSLNRLIEIDDNNKIYWDCFTENSVDGKIWQPFADYRANFTSSLYPCYFSIENMLPSDTITNSKNSGTSIYFKIVNEGSNADSYNILFKNDKNIDPERVELKDVNPGTTQRMVIKIKKKNLTAAQKLTINVISVTNPKLSRQLDYVISK